jgi:hypothetical protein
VSDDERLFCYRDQNRQCDATCVAYLVTRPEGDDYANAPWAQCVELTSAHRSAKHLTILAKLVDDRNKKDHIRSQDLARVGSTKL